MSYAPHLCIYHADCMDGFTAAWVVKSCFPDVELWPARYGDPVPTSDKTRGKDILIVDFSYSAQQIEDIRLNWANSIIVLDHHKTAQAALADLPPPTFPGQPGVYAVFDMDKSGARLAWEFCWPEHGPAPALVAYVEDRDLWRWRLPDSALINAALGTYTYDLRQWDLLAGAVETAAKHPGDNILTFEGAAVVRAQERQLTQVVSSSLRTMKIGGHIVPVVNAPFFMASELGNELSQGHPFAASYFDGRDGRKFSLRSRPDGVDVSEIAKLYGGGGHKNAAGFECPIGWEGDLL